MSENLKNNVLSSNRAAELEKLSLRNICQKVLPLLKKTLFYLLLLFFIGGSLVFINYYAYAFLTKDRIFTDIEKLPVNKVGLVLGTSKYYRTGYINQYYKTRIEGAHQLLKANKVSYLLLSGDNRVVNYNEPITMRKDLIDLGVDPSLIFLDYAGFRTLDSIIRAKSVFQTPSYTIVTQRFHCERALFIAKFSGVDAVCFAVADPNSGVVHFREVLARAKSTLDLFLLNKEPYFLGPLIEIPSEQPIKSIDEKAIEQPHTRKTLTNNEQIKKN